jgi:hypothetical protein
VCANNLTKHIALMNRSYDRLEAVGLKIKPSKFHGNYRQMKVISHVMTRLGRYLDPELVRSIKDLGTPTSQGDVRSLLGLAMVAREYIHELSSLLAPLRDHQERSGCQIFVEGQDAWSSAP